jgi:uncharacterized protein (DUF1778 family)
MATSPALRTHRTEARLLPHQKKRIARAAKLRGMSMSDFIVQLADEGAVRTIREHEAWVLTEADRDILVKALLNPPPPNARLRAAAKRYRQLVRNPL